MSKTLSRARGGGARASGRALGRSQVTIYSGALRGRCDLESCGASARELSTGGRRHWRCWSISGVKPSEHGFQSGRQPEAWRTANPGGRSLADAAIGVARPWDMARLPSLRRECRRQGIQSKGRCFCSCFVGNLCNRASKFSAYCTFPRICLSPAEISHTP